jgi:hypothetical protein
MLDVNMDSISGLGQNTSPFTTHPYSKGFMAFSPWRGQFIKVSPYYQA